MQRPASLLPRARYDWSDLNGLLPLLQQLDTNLDRTLNHHEQAQPSVIPGPDISEFGAARDGQSALPKWQKPGETFGQLQLRPDSPVAWLQQIFHLSELELRVLMIALAPELDRRYEKLYAYLQDDARCLRPTVDLTLSLVSGNALERLEQRRLLTNDAPLVRHRLLHLVANSDGGKPTFLSQELQPADSVIQLLLGQSGLEPGLAAYCRWHVPAALPEPPAAADWDSLKPLVQAAWHQQRPLRLYLQSADRDRLGSLVMAMAALWQRPVISTHISQLIQEKVALAPLLSQMVRSAWFQNAVLYLDDLEALPGAEHQHLYPQVWEAIAEHPGLTVLSGSQPYRVIPHNRVGVLTVVLPELAVEQRQICWQQQLQAVDLALEADAIAQLSDRYQLTPTQIANGVDIACQLAQGQGRTAALPDLLAAARAQCGHDLATHALKIDPHYTWDDIVLPAAASTQLRQICDQAKYRHLVQDTWGFRQKLALGQGLTALFAGPPGTGKTMAAEVIAHDLELDLYKIDLSQVVSKYIGETEKSLNRIFTAATNANAVLLFDEADALFGKRTEVKDAHDRYANIETSYLLQKMEEYQGIAILTTNLQSNMDDAFVRRLRFIVEFAMPGVTERRRIWQQIWPAALPLAEDLDLDFLAANLEIPGAVIRNIALQAAYLAAAAGTGRVGMAQIIPAVRCEYQKMGKILMAEDLKQYGDM